MKKFSRKGAIPRSPKVIENKARRVRGLRVLIGVHNIVLYGLNHHVIFNIPTGKFWGSTPWGRAFHSDRKGFDKAPWMQKLLRFFWREA